MLKKNVFINNENQIEIIFNENIDEKKLKEMLGIAAKIIKNNTKQNAKNLLLVNVQKVDHVSISARIHGSAWLLRQPLDKVAVYGENLYMKYFVALLIKALNIQKRMRFFSYRNDAQSWLQEHRDHDKKQTK